LRRYRFPGFIPGADDPYPVPENRRGTAAFNGSSRHAESVKINITGTKQL